MNLVHKWWDWCSESLAHTFAGVTAPILIVAGFFVVLFYATQGGDGSSPLPPRSDVAGVCVTGTPGATVDAAACDVAAGMAVTTPTPVPPTPTPAPRTYTVQAGDTLSRICGNEAPDMALDDCVGRIIELSDLDGPDDMIFEGQQLTLPPGSSSASNRRPASSSQTTANAQPTQPASLVAIGPSNETPADEPADEPETEVIDEPEVVDEPETEVVEESDEDEAVEDPEPTEEPSEDDIDASAGSEYVIESGDSLLGICVNLVPEMAEGECVEFVVLLNGLADSDDIIEGQTIFLP